MNIINSDQWISQSRRVCGLMTGTSLDAIDIAIVDFNYQNGEIDLKVVDFTSIDFPKHFRDSIIKIFNHPNLSDISDINFALSKLYSIYIREFCDYKKLDYNSIDCISSHGQTVWHNPEIRDFAGLSINSTLQLANGSALAIYSGKPVISDFRSADIALSGQGAPLVPIFDYEYLSVKNKNVISLNIGGISNITYLKANGNCDDVIAFDTGVGNILLDMTVKKYYNIDFDHNGEIAFSGKLNKQLLESLFDCEYFYKIPPKSTGRELFTAEYLNSRLENISISNKDLVHTLSVFTAESIYRQILKFTIIPDIIIVSGGGAYNLFLIDYLKNKLKQSEFKISDDFNIPISAKEAICFAYLGYRTLAGLNSNLPSVTGASRPTILGSISLP